MQNNPELSMKTIKNKDLIPTDMSFVSSRFKPKCDQIIDKSIGYRNRIKVETRLYVPFQLEASTILLKYQIIDYIDENITAKRSGF